MVTGTFQSQFNYFKLRNDAVWFEDLPAISAEVKKSATNLSGTYTIVYPNPAGLALNKFNQFDNQELWFAHVPTGTMYRVFVGQATNVSPKQNLTLEVHGRGLSGRLTDRKISDSWESKRGDFILCDPTFGVIPTYFPDITTWNAFTDDYDQFDYFNETRWGAQPAWADTINGTLEITGDAGATRAMTSTTHNNFETFEARVKVSAASDYVRFGFTDATRTNYAMFELRTASMHCMNADGIGSQDTATVTAITQTDYNYYRIEWAAGEVRFFVNGVLEVTETSNSPVALLYPFFEAATTASVVSVDYMKVIALTAKWETYVAKDKIGMDVCEEITDVGNSFTDFPFFVDDDWDFNAQPTDSISSGYSFGYNSALYYGTYETLAGVDLNNEAKDLYNLIRITGGEMMTTVVAPNWTNQFTGNGTQTAFALGYKAKKPLTLLQVNAVTKTEDTDFSVTYGTEHTIVQFTTAPPNGHSVNVRYDYYTPIIATARNQVSIDGYGVTREYSKDDDTITSQDRASKLANALLLFYSDPRAVIKIKIPLDPRQAVGTSVKIDAPYFGITNAGYDIIELSDLMAGGRWGTELTLANSEINTSAEITREILQQLKALKTKGDTTTISVDEFQLKETMGMRELLEYKIEYICDSFILGHTGANGQLGRGIILEEWEAGVGVWTGSSATLSSETTICRVGTKSLKVIASANTFAAISAQSFGNVSGYTGVASGAPSTGTLGVWVYCTVGTEINAIVLQFGSSSSNYTQVSGVKSYTGAFGIMAGWNYYVFRLKNGATTNTPVWTAASYARLTCSSTGTPTIYMDYFTIGTGDDIGLNGLGYRSEEVAYATLTVT